MYFRTLENFVVVVEVVVEVEVEVEIVVEVVVGNRNRDYFWID